MCGIGGLLSSGTWIDRRAEAENVARQLLGRIARRGPDGLGVWGDAHALLVHSRLSIRDLSDAGAQPFASRDGSVVAVYNGELYNAQYVARRLGAGTFSAKTNCDTEIVVEAIAEYGLEACLSMFDGMFALAAYFPDRKELVVARDRFGEKPLFWASQKSSFVFGSDSRQVAVAAGSPVIPNPVATNEFFAVGYVVGEGSIFEGVRRLRPGHLLRARVRGDAVVASAPCRYFSAREAARPATEAGGFTAEGFVEVLDESVRSRLVSDAPLGVMLSGGFDSQVVATIARRHHQGDLYAFTVASGSSEDVARARELARRLGLMHEVVELPDNPQDLAEAAADSLGEPLADTSMIPTTACALAAKSSVRVLLTGDGGDEMLGGYTRHQAGPIIAAAASRINPSLLRGLTRSVVWGVGRLNLDELESARITRFSRAFGDGQLRFGSLFAGTAMAGAPNVWRLEPGLPGSGLSKRSDWQLADVESFLPDSVCTKVDRALMYAGVEGRAPFLNSRLLPAVGTGLERKAVRRLIAPPGWTPGGKRGFGLKLSRGQSEHLRELLLDTIRTTESRRILSSLDLDTTRLAAERGLGRSAFNGNWSAVWPLFILLRVLSPRRVSVDRGIDWSGPLFA